MTGRFKDNALRAVGLSHDEMDAVAGCDQLFERGDGEARGAAKNEI